MISEFKTTPARSFANVFFLAVVFFSCGDRSEAYISLSGQAQGTTFLITYRDSLDRDFSGPVDSLFRLIDKSMSLWDPNSLISRINNNDPDAVPDAHFIQVFNKASAISEMTAGAFDVTLGPLVKAWGFSIKNDAPLPDSLGVDSLKNLTGFRKVKILHGRVIKENPQLQLDFNAIAQGYTVDLICSFLRQKGIEHFLVEIGGELRTQGVNDQGISWQVGIDKPVDSSGKGRPLQTIVSLHNKALATSGSYRKYLVQDGKKLSHVIDPVTGYPVHHKVLSVSVIAEDCISADAYATAFLVMGMDKALEVAKEKDLEIYCIYADEAGQLQVIATPGFSQ